MRHLGKSSVGWKFSFYADPSWPREEAYARWLSQVALETKAGGRIEDEYGQYMPLVELLQMIEDRQTLKSLMEPRPDERATWAQGWQGAKLYDEMRKSDFECDGYDFCVREFS